MTFSNIFQNTYHFEFNKDNLINIFEIDKGYEYAQIDYLFKYLDEIDCKFMVVENYYVDKCYLDDYLHFYANCHQFYTRTCRRVHFFTEIFNLEILFTDIKKSKSLKKNLQSKYLGFTVIRPIPEMRVGRTLLKVYRDTNLLDLIVKSVPFQEQDSVIHACATTAIWTVLEHSTHKFQYYSPTPYEIRTSAPNFSNHRPIPTSGLTVLEIIGAIRYFGMEIEIGDYHYNKPKYCTFSSFLYAYLRGGIPVLLSVDLYESDETPIGGHALAVLGYHLKTNQPEGAKYFLTGNKIDN